MKSEIFKLINEIFIPKIGNKYKKFNTSKEALVTSKNIDLELKKSFIYSSFQENYFYIHTGIRTNTKNIPVLHNFYNKIGVDWSIIRKAQSYLKIDKDEINLELKKSEIQSKNIIVVIAFVFFYIGLGLCIFLINSSLFDTKLALIIVPFCVFSLFIAIGYFLIRLLDSTHSAHIIQKRLNQITN